MYFANHNIRDLKNQNTKIPDTVWQIAFFFVGKKAVLANGFIKKTMKAPNSEIELAKRYRKDYFMRNPDGR